jgi:hypothetical protein
MNKNSPGNVKKAKGFFAGILTISVFVVILFIFTGRIFLEIFELLIIPLPKKLSTSKRKSR